MIDAAVSELAPIVGVKTACDAVGEVRRVGIDATRCTETSGPEAAAAAQPRALSDDERAELRGVLNSDDHVDKAPATVYAKLLDDGRYLASVSTMYRVLREHGEVGERHATHSATVKPELVATAPRPISPKPSSKTRSASSASNATS